MPLSNAEFQTILLDGSKRVEVDIDWSQDEDHSPASEFRVPVESDAGYPLQLVGHYNPLAKCLTFCVVHRTFGAIYRLDLGKEHHNPDCNLVGEMHKHSYEEGFADKKAYVPPDITARLDNIAAVWAEFCKEAGIMHTGSFRLPTPYQVPFFI